MVQNFKLKLKLKIKTFPRKNLWLITVIVLILLVCSVFFKQNNIAEITTVTNVIDIKPANIIKDNMVDNQTVHQEKQHRLNSCSGAYGETEKSIEDYYSSSSPIVDGYKVLLDCSHAVNSYYPEEKDEYFVVENVKTHNKYYLVDNKKYVLGSLNILGVNDNFLFYNYCWEGCGSPEYIELSSAVDERKIGYVYPETIDSLYRQGVPRDSWMMIYKNKILFISAHKVQELTIDNFGIQDIKTINKDEIFGSFGEAMGEFMPDFVLQDNGILFKIYKTNTETLESKGVQIGTYLLRI